MCQKEDQVQPVEQVKQCLNQAAVNLKHTLRNVVNDDEGIIEKLIRHIGSPKAELARPWIRYLCGVNGFFSLMNIRAEIRDKMLHRTKSGERKVAAFSQMNHKYVGIFRLLLFLHILAGTISTLGSCLAVSLEDSAPDWSRRLAKWSSAAEVFIHGPSALALSPIVYGDKGITPPIYSIVSACLCLSGASALKETLREEQEEKRAALTDAAPRLRPEGRVRPELRRMCTTIAIFIYVRLFYVMRGPHGALEPQKYSVAVVLAGMTMAPVGWARGMFPFTFWSLWWYNRRTVALTHRLVYDLGVDEAASKMSTMLNT